MSNRFHNKWHRHNHHTLPVSGEPDSSHDPIASPSDPFRGDFVVNGSISANGSITVSALSAGSVYTSFLRATSSIVDVTDMSITELSGFMVIGPTAQNLTITPYNPATYSAVTLSGVPVSGNSWASFAGDLQTSRNFYASNAYITNTLIAASISSAAVSTDNLFVGNSSIHFYNGTIISSPLTSSVNIYGDLTATNSINSLKTYTSNLTVSSNTEYPKIELLSPNLNINMQPGESGSMFSINNSYTGVTVLEITDTSSTETIKINRTGLGPSGEGIYLDINNSGTDKYTFSNSSANFHGNSINNVDGLSANNLTVNNTFFVKSVSANNGNGTSAIDISPLSSNNAAFYNLVLISGVNIRASKMMIAWDTSNIVFNESSTTDIGDTNGIALSANISGNYATLYSVVTAGTWTIKGSKELV